MEEEMKKMVHTKERIIVSTIEIIHELGMHGLSTREIAKRLAISEGTIFKHYASKKDIFLAVLEHYSQFDIDIIKTTELKKLEPKEAILFFVNAYMEYYENYPAITAIGQNLEELGKMPALSSKIEAILYLRTRFLIDQIEIAKEKQLFSKALNSELLADIINGSLIYISLKWRLSHFSFSLRKRTITSINMIFNQFLLKG